MHTLGVLALLSCRSSGAPLTYTGTCVATQFPPRGRQRLCNRQAKEDAEQEAALMKRLNAEIHTELEQVLHETDQLSTADREKVLCFVVMLSLRRTGNRCTQAHGSI